VRVKPAVAHRGREELYEQMPKTVAVGGVQALDTAVRNDSRRVGADKIHVLEQEISNPLSQIILPAAGRVLGRSGCLCVHV
jgi:hypothetical protein